MHQTAKALKKNFKDYFTQMNYADMHCDSLTVCLDRGGDIQSFAGQVNLKKLKRAGNVLQCFAIFTQGKKAAADFERYAAFYNAQIKSGLLRPVKNYADYLSLNKGETGAILTVENLGFLKGDVSQAARLKQMGVCMASLCWNAENEFAYPNLIFSGGTPDFKKREERGLKPAGRLMVEALNANKIIVDISHLSDGGAEEVLSISKAPVVASHSNCRKVYNISRNLTDSQLKGLADTGGVAGLNFCFDFIGKDPFEGLYLHLKHMLDVGGEDLPAIGSDFDGIPPYPQIPDCESVQRLFDYFKTRGISARVLEKVALKNFLRVFKEVNP